LSIRLLALVLTLFLSQAAPLIAAGTAHAADLPYADGDLLQASGDDKMYVVQSGQRHWIADTLSLSRLKPDFTRLKHVTFQQLSAVPVGKAIHAGPLIRDAATGRVYLLTRETDWPAPRKHWVSSLDAFTALGFDWSEIATDWSVPPDQYAYAPSLTFVPLPLDPAPLTVPEGTFTAIPEWHVQAQDDRLFLALAVAYTYSPNWRDQIASKLAPAGTWIEWGTLPADVGGLYDAGENTITVNQSLQGEAIGVIAATLAHEALHAVSPHGGDASACLNEEATAFDYQAETWSSIPMALRSNSTQARYMDALVTAYRQQGPAGILTIVSSDPAYQQECTDNGTPRHSTRPLTTT
jgi:hypothetical protein